MCFSRQRSDGAKWQRSTCGGVSARRRSPSALREAALFWKPGFVISSPRLRAAPPRSLIRQSNPAGRACAAPGVRPGPGILRQAFRNRAAQASDNCVLLDTDHVPISGRHFFHGLPVERFQAGKVDDARLDSLSLQQPRRLDHVGQDRPGAGGEGRPPPVQGPALRQIRNGMSDGTSVSVS